MIKKYVQTSLSDFINENKVEIQRKYNNKSAVSVKPVSEKRDKVLNFIAENKKVSRKTLLKYVQRVNENASPNAAAMWVKRYDKMFIKENNASGVLTYKLSTAGKKVLNISNKINEGCNCGGSKSRPGTRPRGITAEFTAISESINKLPNVSLLKLNLSNKEKCVLLESRGMSHVNAVKLIKQYNSMVTMLSESYNKVTENKCDFVDKIGGKNRPGIVDSSTEEDSDKDIDENKEKMDIKSENKASCKKCNEAEDFNVEMDDSSPETFDTETGNEDFADDMPTSDESKIEIKEFVLTVDDVEEAKRELKERGIIVDDNIGDDSFEEEDITTTDMDGDGEFDSMEDDMSMEGDFDDDGDMDSFEEDTTIEEDDSMEFSDNMSVNEDDDSFGEEDDISMEDDSFGEGDDMSMEDDSFGEGEIKISTEGWTEEQFKEFNDWLQQYGLNAEDLLGGKLEMEEVSSEDLTDNSLDNSSSAEEFSEEDDFDTEDEFGTTDFSDKSVEESSLGMNKRRSFGH